jgi:hypothetical protein
MRIASSANHVHSSMAVRNQRAITIPAGASAAGASCLTSGP